MKIKRLWWRNEPDLVESTYSLESLVLCLPVHGLAEVKPRHNDEASTVSFKAILGINLEPDGDQLVFSAIAPRVYEPELDSATGVGGEGIEIRKLGYRPEELVVCLTEGILAYTRDRFYGNSIHLLLPRLRTRHE